MPSARQTGAERGLRWSNWNLLLLVPLLMLVTSWFNTDGPRILGLPFFYWYQFAFVPVGVLCVGIVFAMTRDEPVETGADLLDVDDLDVAEKAGTEKSGIERSGTEKSGTAQKKAAQKRTSQKKVAQRKSAQRKAGGKN
jgi:hypothetical protein